uniref:F-box-like protein n=1 Tax=Pithovirus LCPAC401 TaxID=2506595 RepID=A0A481ZBK8_9VIRU|nr:MAG: F-box-like protein [Pithovirus LCPAC401]
MSSVTEILKRLRIKNQNLDNLSYSHIQSIFETITIREISLLCTVSKKFNAVCNDQSLWRKRVLNDYGIKKKFGDTWRETAKNMYKVNMINLNDKWVNGQTYGRILRDASEMKEDEGWEYMRDLYVDAIDKIIGKELRIEMYDEDEFSYSLYDDDLYEIFRVETGLMEDQIEKMAMIHSREINIIHATIASATRWDKHLPGISLNDTKGYIDEELFKVSIMEIFPTFYIIDPIFYVMQFSAYPDINIKITILDFLEGY